MKEKYCLTSFYFNLISTIVFFISADSLCNNGEIFKISVRPTSNRWRKRTTEQNTILCRRHIVTTDGFRSLAEYSNAVPTVLYVVAMSSSVSHSYVLNDAWPHKNFGSMFNCLFSIYQQRWKCSTICSGLYIPLAILQIEKRLFHVY